MRIDELTPSQVRDLTKGKHTPSQLRRKLASMGYKILGSGEYADVYASDENEIVIKVSTQDDPCWEGFAKIARGPGRGNPHFPRVAGVKRVETGDGDYFIAFMERLEPLTGDKFKSVARWVDRTFELLMGNRVTTDELLSRFDDGIDLPGATPSVMDKIDRKLVEAVILLYKHLPRGCDNDLHEDNFMVRDDDTLVIIDPFWEDA